MLDAGDAMKQDISKRTVCLNDSSKTLKEDLKEILTTTITTAEEVVARIQDTRDEAK